MAFKQFSNRPFSNMAGCDIVNSFAKCQRHMNIWHPDSWQVYFTRYIVLNKIHVYTFSPSLTIASGSMAWARLQWLYFSPLISFFVGPASSNDVDNPLMLNLPRIFAWLCYQESNRALCSLQFHAWNKQAHTSQIALTESNHRISPLNRLRKKAITWSHPW